MFINTTIKSTGAYIPETIVDNQDFMSHDFLMKNGQPMEKDNVAIIQKLEEISQISRRRYENQHGTHYMAVAASEDCLEKADFDRERLGGIIVAHNFGDFGPGETQGHLIPNLAAKVKNGLGIRNSKCFAFDVLFGCPGWLQAMDQGHQYIQNGVVDSILVVGVESLSRVIDPNDMDGMLFGDGAGATLITAEESEVDQKQGYLTYSCHSDCNNELDFLSMSKPITDSNGNLRISMNGRGVFKYAMETLPSLISEALDKAKVSVNEVGLFLFHQANGKMIEALASSLSKMHENVSVENKVPLILQELGNTSVATLPTLLDKILEGELPDYSIMKGDAVVFASVGAGMHANAMVYRF